jgi:DNA repair exonuclease SbcCD nuclease subunit
MTIALITDQHLDGRKGSVVFWEYFKKFYDEIFFPRLEKSGIRTIIDLGDTFDNRKGIDFNVWSRVRSHYFQRLEDMGIEVHMILGNHCTYYKNTNDINSPDLLLKDFSNIKVYARPETIKIEGTDILMLPWINTNNYDDVLKHLESTPADIVMGHLELDGFEVTPGMKHSGGMTPDIFSRFKQVFSGHFHHKSKKGNIQYLGNPYQMFWNDYKDERGFHLYEPKTNKLTRVKNPYEIFQKIYYNDTTGSHLSFDTSQCANSFVKIIVEDKKDYLEFEKFVDSVFVTQPHDVKIVETLVNETFIEDTEMTEIKDTLTLLNEYIDEVELTVNKDKLKNLMRTLYIESCEVV